MDNIQPLIALFSDQSRTSVHRVVNYVSKWAPVYEYLFSHKGSFSVAELFGINSTAYGTCQADDLHYVFNHHIVEYPSLGSQSDRTVRDYMVKMWTSFAKTSVPVSPGELPFVWDQYSSNKLEYLKITEEPGNNLFLII